MPCWANLTWTLFIILAYYSAFSKSWDIEERGDPFNDPRFKQILRISCHLNESYYPHWNCPENSKCVDDPNSQINICVCDDEYINPNPYEFGKFIAGSDEVDESSEESINDTSILNNTSVEFQIVGNISSSNENTTSYEYIEVSVEDEEGEGEDERKTRDVKSKEDEEPEDEEDDNDSNDEDDEENDDAIPLRPEETDTAKSDTEESPDDSTEPPEDSNPAEVEESNERTEEDKSKIQAQCVNSTINANYQIQDDDPRWRLLLVRCSETCPTNSECRNGRNCFCKEGYFGDPNANFTICKGLGLKLIAPTFQLLCLFLIAYFL